MRVSALLLFLIAVTSPAFAQTHPDLSGVWTMAAANSSKAATGGGAAVLPPSDLTISQTADALSLSRTAFDRVTTMTYTFDGRENTNKSGAVTQVTRSRWEGAKFIIEGKASQVTSQGYAAWTLKQTLYRNAQGHLIIDREDVASDGTSTKSTIAHTKKKTSQPER